MSLILRTATGFGYVGYMAYSNPLITVPNQFSFTLAVGVIVFAFVIYYLSRWYHKRTGLDISMALKEIPPE